MAMVRRNMGCILGFGRYYHSHVIPHPPPPRLDFAAAVPEFDRSPKGIIGFDFPTFSFAAGSMDLMAVPKRKVSPHKRGIRNGPKALKPVPVIVRCKACGRVKLPHFFCCSGIRGYDDERNG